MARETAMNWRVWLALLVLGGVTCNHVAARDLQPKRYASPSGRFVLTVDPSVREGAASGQYRFEHDGKPVWSGEQPFTLWSASVSDDGHVAGYAYDKGFDCDCGNFVVAIFDANGNLLRADRTERKGSLFLHTAADPKAIDQFIDPVNHRFVVRVEDADLNTHAESWWVYNLIDGKLERKFKPSNAETDPSRMARLADAKPVAGTPLILLHWIRYVSAEQCKTSPARSHDGARFSLLDANFTRVWSVEFPKDYDLPDELAQARLDTEVRDHGAIIHTAQPGQFAVHTYADAQRIDFRVAPDAHRRGKWTVVETRRTPYQAPVVPTRAEELRAVPERQLQSLGAIELQRQAAADVPFDSVEAFDRDDRGRFGVLTMTDCDGNHAPQFVLVDANGKLLRRVAIDAPGRLCSLQFHAAWVGGDRWLITTNVLGDDPKASAAWLDVSTGKFTPLEHFDVQDVKALRGTHDGGFIALTTTHTAYSMQDSLLGFDKDGRQRWAIAEEHGNDKTKLSSAEAVTVTTDNEVVVLENISDELKVYDRNGAYRRTVNLTAAWGRKPNYPSGVAADADGGVFVFDFHGEPSIVHMNCDGAVLESFTPKFRDGRRFDVRDEVRQDRDKARWASDGRALLRLDAQGIVDRVIGNKPDFGALGDVAAFQITHDGKIYAVDQRTAAVHVFDTAGRRLAVCHPDPHDYAGEMRGTSLTIADSGDVFVERDDRRHDFVHYAADCRRVGVERADLDEVAQHWHAVPGSSRRWIVAYQHLYLVDAQNSVKRSFARTADGHWVEAPGAAAIAPDGTMVVVTDASDHEGFSSDRLLTRYSTAGVALETWPLPAVAKMWMSQFAFDGKRVVLPVDTRQDLNEPANISLAAYNVHGKALFRFAPVFHGEEMTVFLVQPHEQPQLWVFDGRAKIERYALPEGEK
jgi:DNA-binding beta-propeller fold protein YncE